MNNFLLSKIIDFIRHTLHPKMPDKLVYSTKEISQMSKLSEREVENLINQGKIKAIQISGKKSGSYRILKTEVERYFGKSTTKNLAKLK